MKPSRKEGLDPAQKKRMMNKSLSPDFLDPGLEWRRIFSEIWGTFLLVVAAAGGSMMIVMSGGAVTQAMAVTAAGTIAAQGTLGIDD